MRDRTLGNDRDTSQAAKSFSRALGAGDSATGWGRRGLCMGGLVAITGFRSIRSLTGIPGRIFRPHCGKLTGGEFERSVPYGRNFVSPGFLYLLLRFFEIFARLQLPNIFSGF